MKTRSLLAVLALIAMLVASNSLVFAQDPIPRGGTFVVSEGQQDPFPRNFNPYAPNPTRWARGAVFESLMIFNAPLNELVPWLATGYEYSEDLLTLTFKLQEGVKWNDGEDFNADDVVFALNLFQQFPALDRPGVLPYLESVEKIDDYTVAIHLTQVFTLAHYLFANMYPLPEHIWSAVDDPVTFTNENPVATGPLATVKTVNEQVLELCRNENYWQIAPDGQPLPYVDCMRMPVMGNDPANLAAANGELDWFANFIPDIDTTYVAANPEHHHYYFWPGSNVISLYFNTDKAPFDDVAFRHAVSMAIDYDSVVGIGMYGYTMPAKAHSLSPAFEKFWSADAQAIADEIGLNTYDPDAAAAALDAAGYVDADGDDWRDMPDGSPLSFKVQVVNGWTDWVTSVQIISENLQDIGLDAVIDVLDFGIWFNNLQSGTYDTSIGWGSGGAQDPWFAFSNIIDSRLLGEDGIANAQLWSRWSSPETDQLLKDYVATIDPAVQADILNQLQVAFVENMPLVPLFPGPTWYEWTTYRFTGFPTEEDYYVQGSTWTVQPDQYVIALLRIHCVSEETCAEAK